MSQPASYNSPVFSLEQLASLTAVLERAKQRGFLGPGPVGNHIEHALPILTLVAEDSCEALDLGSGGGVPGLVLALARPGIHWTLLDGSVTRSRFLQNAVQDLDLSRRVKVTALRAEEAARSALRGSFDTVTARSFGAPAVTAECGSPFLAKGGRLIVAEPPEGAPSRWPPKGLEQLGMVPGVRVTSPSTFQVLEQVVPCADRYPRRTGIPAKRPLF